MGRTRHTRKRHTRRKQKRKRTRHRRSGHKGGVNPVASIVGGGIFLERSGTGGRKIKGGKKYKYPNFLISDISPGDKRAMASDRRKFEKALKSLKHKKKKSRKKRKSRKHKRRRRKH